MTNTKHHTLLLLLVTVLLVVIIGCNQSIPQLKNDPKMFMEYSETYIEPIGYAGLLYENWNDAEELNPNRLMAFYEIPFFHLSGMKAANQTIDVSESKVEKYIQNYFQVSSEHLRKATIYDPEQRVYSFLIRGTGSAPMPPIKEIVQNGDVATFFLGKMEEITPADQWYEVTLSIQLEKDGFHYISSKCVLHDAEISV